MCDIYLLAHSPWLRVAEVDQVVELATFHGTHWNGNSYDLEGLLLLEDLL